MRIYQYITYIISLALVFLSPSHGLQSIFPKIQSKIPNLMQTGAEILTSLNSDTSTFKLPLGPPAKTSSKYLYFTGAGIYFWWQVNAASIDCFLPSHRFSFGVLLLLGSIMMSLQPSSSYSLN